MKISIVVRTHNDIPYIAQTLQCLQNQQIDAETEIMIIDNESTDGTSVWSAASIPAVSTSNGPQADMCRERF